MKKLLGPDRTLELAGLTATVEKVFRLTRMDTIFTIHATLDAAVANAVAGELFRKGGKEQKAVREGWKRVGIAVS